MVVSCGRFIRNISKALNIEFRIHADTHTILASIKPKKNSLRSAATFSELTKISPQAQVG